MSIKREYKAYLYDHDQVIDETCIDENDEVFAMYLFEKEFGHHNLSEEAYVIIEPLGFYDTATGDDIKVEQLEREERINPFDDMPQFKLTYANGEQIVIEARDLEELLTMAEEG